MHIIVPAIIAKVKKLPKILEDIRREIVVSLKLERKVHFDKTSYFYAFLLYPQRNVSKCLTSKFLFSFLLID